jgi:hypothetical protein
MEVDPEMMQCNDRLALSVPPSTDQREKTEPTPQRVEKIAVVYNAILQHEQQTAKLQHSHLLQQLPEMQHLHNLATGQLRIRTPFKVHHASTFGLARAHAVGGDLSHHLWMNHAPASPGLCPDPCPRGCDRRDCGCGYDCAASSCRGSWSESASSLCPASCASLSRRLGHRAQPQ